MLDIVAVAWLALCIVVLGWTRANRYLVIGTLGSTVIACWFAASVWMNGALSAVGDEQSAQRHVSAATTYEVLTALALAAAATCLVLAWRRRPRRAGIGRSPSVAQSGTV
jgi:hypothetical protein